MKHNYLPVAFIDLPKDAQFQMMIINYLRKKNHKQDFITNAKLTEQATRAAMKFAVSAGLNYSAEKIAHAVAAIQAILFLDDLLLASTDD